MKNKAANPDKMTGISDHVYLMQARQLPDRELRKLKNGTFIKIVLKERKIARQRKQARSVAAMLNQEQARSVKPLTIDDLLKDIKT